MIDFVSIENTLNRLDSEYSSSTDTQLTILYSKLSVLELCGWIEVSIDIVLHEYVDSHLHNLDYQKSIKSIIKRTNGFDYEKNLFPLFCSVLGVNNVENIFNVVSPKDFHNLKSITETYTTERNKASHTDTPAGTTRTYKSPSSVRDDFKLIKPAIQTLETQIQLL